MTPYPVILRKRQQGKLHPPLFHIPAVFALEDIIDSERSFTVDATTENFDLIMEIPLMPTASEQECD
jgi:hypothetical protein